MPVFNATGDGEETLTEAEKARRERMREQASGVVSYATSDGGDRVVFALGARLHRVVVATGESDELETDGGAFDPQAEPGSDRVAYASGAMLRITDGSTDRTIPGTDEPGDTISWGTAEFVAAEEMGRGRGYWWNPQGQQMAVCRVDTAPVEQWWISSPEDPAATPRQIRYPAAGTANADVQLWVVDVESGPTVQVDWQRGEFEYLADVQWGDRLLCTVQTRDQRTLVVLDVDPQTGEATEVQRVTDEHWVELQPNTPLVSELGMLMVVDDGNRTVAIDGTSIDLGELQVRSLLGVHDGQMYVTVTTDATDSVIARVRQEGSVEMLTQPGLFANGVLGALAITTARPDGDSTYEVRWVDGAVSEIESFAAARRVEVRPLSERFVATSPRRCSKIRSMPCTRLPKLNRLSILVGSASEVGPSVAISRHWPLCVDPTLCTQRWRERRSRTGSCTTPTTPSDTSGTRTNTPRTTSAAAC